MKKYKNDKEINFRKYSYCSLFWINSIIELKYLIFENSVSKENFWVDINWDDYSAKTESLLKKGLSLIRKTPLNEYAWIWLTFINTKEETLICLDDFERIIDDNWMVINLLWLVSELKEWRKCKVILIFNEEELWNKLDIYNKFKEKIIDIEIEFLPTPEECAEKAFINYMDSVDPDSVLFHLSCKLKVKNIRILKRIKRITALVKPYTEGLNPGVFQQALSSITLLTNAYLGNPNNSTKWDIPSIDYIQSYSPFNSYLQRKEWEKIEHEEKWSQIIADFWWSHTDDFDLELLKIIKRGYIIEEDFTKVAKNVSASFEAGDIDKQYTNIWRNIYHGWFRDNENDFINAFVSLFNDKSEFLSVSQLNDVVTIFRELWKDSDAESIINIYVNSNKEDEDKIKIENGFGFHLNNSLDKEVKEKLLNAYKELKNIPTLRELLDILIEKDFPSNEDETILFNSTEDEIYNLFYGLNWKKFDNYRSILLKYKNVTNPSKEWKELTEKTINALKRFGNNKINKRRLQSYWIE